MTKIGEDLFKCIPPENIRRRLSPLHGLCTYKLLDDIRFGAHKPVNWNQQPIATSVGDWFRQLRETTSEWSYRPQDKDKLQCETLEREGMLSHQWTCMGEELVALDRSTRVPRDAPELQRIFHAVKSVPEHFLRQMVDTYPDLNFDLYEMGSFTTNVKVLDVNEFDFMFLSDSSHTQYFNADDFREVSEFFEALFHSDYNQRDLVIDVPDYKDVVTLKEPVLIYQMTYTHGASACLQVLWSCEENHMHEISIDITLGYMGADSLSSQCVELRHIPALRTVYDGIGDRERVVLLDLGIPTLCTLDRRIWAVLDLDLPHVLTLYRILKVVAHFLLPSEHSGFKAPGSKPFLGSHNIKLCLLAYLGKHFKSEQWETRNLHHRLSDILTILLEKLGLNTKVAASMSSMCHSTAGNDSAKFSMFDFGFSKNNPKDETMIHFVAKSLDNIRKLLRNAYSNTENNTSGTKGEEGNKKQPLSHHHLAPVLAPPYMKYFMIHQEKLYPCRNVADFGELVYASTIQLPDMLCKTHPLLLWCQTEVYHRYLANPGADLTKFLKPMDLCIIWNMFTRGDLSGHELAEYDVEHLTSLATDEEFMKLVDSFTVNVDYQLCYQSIASMPKKDLDTFLRQFEGLTAKERAFLHCWCNGGVYEIKQLIFEAHILSSTVKTALESILRFVFRVKEESENAGLVTVTPSRVISIIYEDIVKENIPGYLDSVTSVEWKWANMVFNEFYKSIN